MSYQILKMTKIISYSLNIKKKLMNQFLFRLNFIETGNKSNLIYHQFFSLILTLKIKLNKKDNLFYMISVFLTIEYFIHFINYNVILFLQKDFIVIYFMQIDSSIIKINKINPFNLIIYPTKMISMIIKSYL